MAMEMGRDHGVPGQYDAAGLERSPGPGAVGFRSPSLGYVGASRC